MKKISKRALLANAFGSLGYIFCLVLWGWVGIQYVPMLLENDQVERILIPQPREDVIAPQPVGEANPITITIGIGITFIIVILTMIILIKAPATIAKTGKTVTTKAASSALPLVTRGGPVSPAKKQYITVELVKLAKLLLILVPVSINFIGAFIETPLPFDVSLLVCSVFALVAVFCFSAQYIFARFLRVTAAALV